MIQWKKYDSASKHNIVSHVDYLVLNGKEVRIAQHCNMGSGVYKWFDAREVGFRRVVLAGVTHYTEINLPTKGDC